MRIQKTLPLVAVALAAFAITACQDGRSAPAAPESSLRPSGPRLTLATTAVTTAVLYPTVDNVYVSPEGHRLSIPANSVCVPGTSGYGPGTWDLPCQTATAPIVFTITSTTDANGRPRITVQPDVRFSPSKVVTASFVDQTAANAFAALIRYCPTVGTCIDESKTDPSLKTYQDPATGRVYRRLKHFSGYTVVFGVDGCDNPDGCWIDDGSGGGPLGDREAGDATPDAGQQAERSGYITTTGRSLGSTN
jgi:hypothetical protein